MINLHLTSIKSWDPEINLLDTVENINATVQDFYDKLKIRFWTCDINVHRLTNNNEMFICDPWVLFVLYNKNKKKFKCTYDYTNEKIFKKFVSLNFKVEPGKEHRIKLLNFVQEQKIDCFYSNLSDKITLTEIPEHFPNGYFDNEFDYGVPKEYFLGLIDIVTEGSCEMSTHFSEKSYKPLFYKKPFISIAGPYWYETFKKHGFELYDEIFDYGFDLNENRDDRINDILMQIRDLNLLKYEDLLNLSEKLKPKIEHNYNHLFTLKSKMFEHISHDDMKNDLNIDMEHLKIR